MGLLAALEAQATTYAIHPGVAEAARAAAEAARLDAADVELGDYHIAVVRRGLQDGDGGRGGHMVAERRPPRRALPAAGRGTLG